MKDCTTTIPASAKTEEEEWNGLLEKRRRIMTEIYTLPSPSTERAKELFQDTIGPLLDSGYLSWYDAIALSKTNVLAQQTWRDGIDTYAYGWNLLQSEVNEMNGCNRCIECERTLHPKKCRHLCTSTDNDWEMFCSNRQPSLTGVLDIILASGFLSWRDRGSTRRINVYAHNTYSEQCTCPTSKVLKHVKPYVTIDPRFRYSFHNASSYAKCKELVSFTSKVVSNFHQYYGTTEKSVGSVPQRSTIAIPTKDAPHQYTKCSANGRATRKRQHLNTLVTIMGLYKAQQELYRSSPICYRGEFCGEHDLGQNDDGATIPGGERYLDESTESVLHTFLMSVTAQHVDSFLQRYCYPTQPAIDILGPLLINRLSLFRSIFKHFPLATQ